MRKYRLSEQTRQYCYQEEHGKQSVTLRQIVALIDFADVKAGSEGGWVDTESALSQQGLCWIYDANSVVSPGRSIRRRCPAHRPLRGQSWGHHPGTGLYRGLAHQPRGRYK